MSRRYVSRPLVVRRRPQADDEPCWDHGAPLTPALTVYEDDGEARPTGLCDALGNELLFVAQRRSIGFLAGEQ